VTSFATQFQKRRKTETKSLTWFLAFCPNLMDVDRFVASFPTKVALIKSKGPPLSSTIIIANFTHTLSLLIIDTMTEDKRKCFECFRALPKNQYSKNQWRKAQGQAKCLLCTGAGNGIGILKGIHQGQNQPARSIVQPLHKHRVMPLPVEPKTEVKASFLKVRPLKVVPGYEEQKLTVCADWPKVRKPLAQSAIFMPLLACVIGPVKGQCTQEQLDDAMKWWTCALPAWPRWVAALKNAGVPRQRSFLLRTSNWEPTPLIPLMAVHGGKHPGSVPHFRGSSQIKALERDQAVAWEIYACVTCLYSLSEDSK
jgi:hypothetical protein